MKRWSCRYLYVHTSLLMTRVVCKNQGHFSMVYLLTMKVKVTDPELARQFVQKVTNMKTPSRTQTRLYSFKLSCRMVSFTAANTNRMFSVSVKRKENYMYMYDFLYYQESATTGQTHRWTNRQTVIPMCHYALQVTQNLCMATK